MNKEISRSVSILTKQSRLEEIQEVSNRIKVFIAESSVPPELRSEIHDACKNLAGIEEDGMPFLAVRSSSPIEDVAETSLAGMFASYLYIRGEEQVIEAFKKCVASQFSQRAIFYKLEHGLDLTVSIIRHCQR